MKNRYIYIFMMALFAVFACERVEELSQPEKEQGNVTAVEKVEMTFSAVIESDDTKTVLVDSGIENVKKVFWQPGDAIAVSKEYPVASGGYYDNWGNWVSGTYVPTDKFTATTSAPVSKTEFDGRVEFASKYKAFYPYAENVTDSSNVFYFDFPSVQKYVDGSFDPNAAPMVATASYGETFNFKNVYGILALNIKGEEKVSSITFTAVGEYGSPIALSGRFSVNPYDEEPVMTPLKGLGYTLTLDCDEPVQLDPTNPTPFYLILPPGTYSSFTLTIATPTGRKMLKSGHNPLTLQRSHIKPTGDLEYVETTNVDLSLDGTANCYIVTESGYYSIDANVIGNGDFGIIKGANFHTDDSRITPASAELLWEDHSGSVLGVTYEKGVIKFMTTGVEGNAVIAAKDADGTILWSWHIWCTDQPQVQTYVNSTGNYDVLDRNLGATRADRGEGEQWKEAVGLVYQWGRKDPFNQQFVGYTTHYDRASVEDAIMNPNIYYGRDYSSWLNCDMNPNYWTPSQKTIYDPCPAGYLVAYNDVWRSFTTSEINEVYNPAALNVFGNFDHGWDWKYDGVNTTYYPITFNINAYSASYDDEYACEMWQSVNFDSNQAYVFQYRAHPNDTFIFFVSDGYDRRSDMKNGRMVRCVRDGQTKNVSMNISPEEEVTATSVKVRGRVSVYGKTLEVTERGFVYGTDQNVTQANGQGVVCGEGIGEFDACIEGLTPLTKYYVRAYAATTDGLTHYSSAIDFITPGDGGVVNLSIGGSANCYIVDPVKAKYEIDLVKGNSQTSVGNATDAIILWETYNTNDAVSSGTVVESAKIENGKLVIEIPENVHPGNAIVAVRNSSGTILWSWHIWVADYDPEATVQTYVSGAVLMDRNLGAISATPGTIESYGLYYQWGRKDPFVINGYMLTAPDNAIIYQYKDPANDNISQAIKNPCVVYNDANWGYDTNLWSSNKTMYDPCPAGWRVMDSSAWSDVERASSYVYGYFRVSSEYATPNGASIPTAGRTDGDGYVSNCYEYGYYFTTNRDLQYYFHYSSHKMSTIDYGEDNLMSVRCQKIDQSDKPGNGDDYIIDDEYEWE